MNKRESWWCLRGQCFSCTYTCCAHACHAGQLAPLAPEQRERAAAEAGADLARYFDTSTSWRAAYAHTAAIAAAHR